MISFRSLDSPDAQLLYQWFQQPEVRQWYAKGQSFSKQEIITKYSPRVKGEEKIPCFIICCDGEPVGFIQYYILADYLPEGVADFSHLLFKENTPSEMAGIDLFIGDVHYLNKGIGSKVISEFLRSVMLPHFKAVVVDPDIENKRAVKAYQKAGFTPFSIEKSEKYSETIQLMVYRFSYEH